MKTEKDDKRVTTDKNKESQEPISLFGRKKTTIPPKRKAPDTDEEGIGVVHEPQ